MRPGRGPGPALPAGRQRGGRALAALPVRAGRGAPDHRLPAAEPPRVLERDAQCDGKATLATLVDERRAPVRPRLRVRVLVVRAEPVVGDEYLPARPLAAHPLALDRAGGVGREHHAVILVRLVD